MKTKNLFTIGLIFSSSIIYGQNNTGKVIYDEIIKLDFIIDSLEQNPQMADIIGLMPKEQHIQKVLYFTNEASLFQADKEKIEEVKPPNINGNNVEFKMDQPENKVFFDLKSKKRIEQKEFMTRKFLIETAPDKLEWKLTGNQKMILNYPCQEAILQSTEGIITAWFTPAIPVSTGPEGYGGLPGLILTIEVNGKQNLIITAKTIEFREIDKVLLAIPKEGKKVTEKEYEAIVAEKTKEMKEQYGGNGNVIIKFETR